MVDWAKPIRGTDGLGARGLGQISSGRGLVIAKLAERFSCYETVWQGDKEYLAAHFENVPEPEKPSPDYRTMLLETQWKLIDANHEIGMLRARIFELEHPNIVVSGHMDEIRKRSGVK